MTAPTNAQVALTAAATIHAGTGNRYTNEEIWRRVEWFMVRLDEKDAEGEK